MDRQKIERKRKREKEREREKEGEKEKERGRERMNVCDVYVAVFQIIKEYN